MNCPKCKARLATVTVAGVEIDRCTACHGQWYDEGEVAKLVPLLSKNDAIPDAPAAANPGKGHPAPASHGLRCPKCQAAMQTTRYTDDSSVMVDRCSACRGLWLDAGECAAIVRHVKGNPRLTRVGAALAQEEGEKRREDIAAASIYPDDFDLLAGVLQQIYRAG